MLCQAEVGILFLAKFNRAPDSIAALAYDAVKVLADSMTRANSTDVNVVYRRKDGNFGLIQPGGEAVVAAPAK